MKSFYLVNVTKLKRITQISYSYSTYINLNRIEKLFGNFEYISLDSISRYQVFKKKKGEEYLGIFFLDICVTCGKLRGK